MSNKKFQSSWNYYCKHTFLCFWSEILDCIFNFLSQKKQHIRHFIVNILFNMICTSKHIKTSYREENTWICTSDYQTNYRSPILKNWLFVDWVGQTAECDFTSRLEIPDIRQCTFFLLHLHEKWIQQVFFIIISIVLNLLQQWFLFS